MKRFLVPSAYHSPHKKLRPASASPGKENLNPTTPEGTGGGPKQPKTPRKPRISANVAEDRLQSIYSAGGMEDSQTTSPEWHALGCPVPVTQKSSEDAPAVPGRLWPVEQQLDDAAGEEESQREDFLGFGESQVYEGDTEESQLAPSGFRQTQSYEGDAEESQVFHDHAEQTLVDQPSATEKAPACPMPDPEPTDPHKINEMNVQLTQQLLTLDIQKAEIERLQEQALDEKEARRLLDETIACQKEKIEKIQGHAVQDQSTIRALQRQITEQLKQIRDLESLTQTQKDAIQEFTAQADTHERIREGLEITVKNNRQQIRTMEGIELDLRKTLEDRRDRNTALCNQITDLRASHAKTLATSQARYRKLAKDKAEEVAVREQELNTEIKRINKELSTRTSELKNIGHKLKKERLDANALRQEYEVLKEEHEGYEDAIKKIRVAVQF